MRVVPPTRRQERIEASARSTPACMERADKAVLLEKLAEGAAVVTVGSMRTVKIANFRYLRSQALAQKLPFVSVWIGDKTSSHPWRWSARSSPSSIS